MNTLTSLLTQLNTALTNNIAKPNKMTTRDLKKRGEVIKTKEAFDFASNCRVANFTDFIESDTKVSIEKYDLTNFIEKLLSTLNSNIQYSVSHKSHSTYSVSIRDLEASAFDLDTKYDKYSTRYFDLFEFKVKKSNTGFGKTSSYFSDIGTLENTKQISEIVITKELKTFDLDSLVLEYFENCFQADNEQQTRAIEDKNKFQAKLSSLNISLEDLSELISLKNSHDYSKQFLKKS
jgi:hypothetical protein